MSRYVRVGGSTGRHWDDQINFRYWTSFFAERRMLNALGRKLDNVKDNALPPHIQAHIKRQRHDYRERLQDHEWLMQAYAHIDLHPPLRFYPPETFVVDVQTCPTCRSSYVGSCKVCSDVADVEFKEARKGLPSHL